MRDERFEWHGPKAASNFRKHGVTFDAARAVFDDVHHVEEFDDDWYDDGDHDGDHDGDRWVRIGLSDGHVLVVGYTERGRRVRIISAREANPDEQERYFK